MTAIALPTRDLPLLRAIPAAGRILLGLTFFVCGLDYFVELLPRPTGPMSEGAMAFAGGLVRAGYMFPFIKGTEVAMGALLLANRLVPLALVVLAPIVLNIFAFHLFLAPSGLLLAGAIVAVEIGLAWHHREAFRPLLSARARG